MDPFKKAVAAYAVFIVGILEDIQETQVKIVANLKKQAEEIKCLKKRK